MSPTPIWPQFLCRLFRLALLGIALGGPILGASGTASAEEPTIDELEYDPKEVPPDAARGRVLLVGAALTAGWYGASVGTSYLWSDAPNAKDLRLPVVGPWLALGDTGCGSSESSCSTLIVIGRTALAVVSGVGQAGGVLALVEGIFMPTGSGAAAPKAATNLMRDVGAQPSWVAVPVALPDGAGIEVSGRF
jgi:hypothetical protein